MSQINLARRRLMGTTLAGIAVGELAFLKPAAAQSAPAGLGAPKQIAAGVLRPPSARTSLT